MLCDVIFLVRLQEKFESVIHCAILPWQVCSREDGENVRFFLDMAPCWEDDMPAFPRQVVKTSCERAWTLNSQVQKVQSPDQFWRAMLLEVLRIGSIIIFHLSKLWIARFSIFCDVIFLVRLQGKFEIDHSERLKGFKVAKSSDWSRFLALRFTLPWIRIRVWEFFQVRVFSKEGVGGCVPTSELIWKFTWSLLSLPFQRFSLPWATTMAHYGPVGLPVRRNNHPEVPLDHHGNAHSIASLWVVSSLIWARHPHQSSWQKRGR